MSIPGFLERIAREHDCPPELARNLVTAGLAALHEASYTRGTEAGVSAAHAELGGLAAWHLMGLLVDAADGGNPAALIQAYAKVEASPAQYDPIWAQWAEEKTRGG